MNINVLIDGDSVPIDHDVFVVLLENSVASEYVDYQRALDKGSIKFEKLVWLARKGEIPYSLFFAPIDLVRAQVATKTRKLLEGISKDTFSVNSRETVELRRIELIVKDLLRKQALLKQHRRDMRQAARAGRRVVDAARCRARRRDDVGEGPVRRIPLRHQRIGTGSDDGRVGEALGRLVGE